MADLDNPFDDAFLDFDNDEFTEDALHQIDRLHQQLVNRLSPPEPAAHDFHNLKECCLFLNVLSVSGIPLRTGCFSGCSSKYYCEVEIMKQSSTCPLIPDINSTDELNCTQRYNATPSRSSNVWSLAEYYGQTKITIKLRKRTLFRDTVVNTKYIKLSELLARQSEQHLTSLDENAWNVVYDVPMHSKLHKKQKQKQAHNHNLNSSTQWFESTAKSLTAATATPPSVGLDIVAEKQRIQGINNPKQGSRVPNYVRIPGTTHDRSAPDHSTKTAEIVVRLQFRLVQLQACVQLGHTVHLSAATTLELTRGREIEEQRTPRGSRRTHASSRIADPSVGSDNQAMQNSTSDDERVCLSELHLLAASAPPTVLVEVMRALSRKDALPLALELRCSVMATEETTIDKKPGNARHVAAEMHRARVHAINNNNSNNNTNNNNQNNQNNPSNSSMCATPFEIALLFKREASVLEMLQRCGSLCFANITPGKGSPLHAAVRGGSPVCVGYIGKYIQKYGARRVTGSGARLWSSSLSVKLEWRDAHGDTALALACRCGVAGGAHGIAVYLLMLGACAAALNEQTQCTPLMYACECGSPRLVSTLLSITKTPQDLMDEILNVGDVSVIMNNIELLDVDAQVRAEIQSAVAAAAQAARTGALSAHLSSNIRSYNILRGRNPAEGGYSNPLAVYSCDPARKEKTMGWNALHLAAQRGNVEIIQMLIEIGMSCADCDKIGDNPLHMAARRGDKSAVIALAQAEMIEWNAYQKLVASGKSLETMRHRDHALFALNSFGVAPIDLAIEIRAFNVVDEILKGAVNAYGTIPSLLAKEYRTKLSVMISSTMSSPNAKSSSLSENKKNDIPSLTESSGLNKSKKHRIDSCMDILNVMIGDDRTDCTSFVLSKNEAKQSGRKHHEQQQQQQKQSSNVLTEKKGEEGEERGRDDEEGIESEESECVDNIADSVEYMLALSPLGLKYITDTAGGGAVSYLPSDQPSTPTAQPAAPLAVGTTDSAILAPTVVRNSSSCSDNGQTKTSANINQQETSRCTDEEEKEEKEE